MKARHLLLGFALAAVLLAAWWVPTDEDAGPTERASARTRPLAQDVRPAGAAATSLAFVREPWPDVVADLVGVPPAPVAVAPVMATAVPALAPPLPFRFVGAMQDDGRQSVFLMYEGRLRMARVSDVIEPGYRVDRIEPSHVEFTYLPLNQRQILDRQTP